MKQRSRPYRGFVNYLAEMAGTDSARQNPPGKNVYVTDDGSGCGVGEWLASIGVPSGWLTLRNGEPADKVVHAAWADGFVKASPGELRLLCKAAGWFQSAANEGGTWGDAAWSALEECDKWEKGGEP